MSHLANTLLTPSSYHADGVLFDVPLTALPGRPIVVMFPADRQSLSTNLVLPDEVRDKYRPDFGVVWDPAGCLGIEKGDVVAVKPYDGLWLTSKDRDWIPEGREVRLYGVASPWHESVVMKIG